MTLQSNDTATSATALLVNDADHSARLAADQALRVIAEGEARGDASIGEFFATLAQQIADGTREYPETAAFYAKRFEWTNAELRRRGRAEIDAPEGNSLSSQMTKANNITRLGVHERTRTGVLSVFRSLASVKGCQWKYTPLNKAANAIGEYLTANPAATDDQLRDAGQIAIDNCQSSKEKTAEGELTKLVKALDKLIAHDAHGAIIIKAEQKRGVGYAKLASDSLALLLNAVKEIEAGAAVDAKVYR